MRPRATGRGPAASAPDASASGARPSPEAEDDRVIRAGVGRNGYMAVLYEPALGSDPRVLVERCDRETGAWHGLASMRLGDLLDVATLLGDLIRDLPADAALHLTQPASDEPEEGGGDGSDAR